MPTYHVNAVRVSQRESSAFPRTANIRGVHFSTLQQFVVLSETASGSYSSEVRASAELVGCLLVTVIERRERRNPKRLHFRFL